MEFTKVQLESKIEQQFQSPGYLRIPHIQFFRYTITPL